MRLRGRKVGIGDATGKDSGSSLPDAAAGPVAVDRRTSPPDHLYCRRRGYRNDRHGFRALSYFAMPGRDRPKLEPVSP